MWKRLAVLIVVALLPVSAVAHTKLFYRMSCRSDYRKVEVVTPIPEPTFTAEPTVTPLVEIPLESTLTPEPTLTPIPTEAPSELPTSTPEAPEQISTPSDVDTPTTLPEEVF